MLGPWLIVYPMFVFKLKVKNKRDTDSTNKAIDRENRSKLND